VCLGFDVVECDSARVVCFNNISFWKSDDVFKNEDGAVL